MHKPVKYVEKALSYVAQGAWFVFERLNRIRPNESFTPKWSNLPLQKSWQKTKPTLGWPRTTDSLCPKCVPEARTKILNGEADVEVLKREKIGEMQMLFRAVLDARERVMLEMNVGEEDLDRIVDVLPCMRAATVSPLYRQQGYAVKAAVPRLEVAKLVPQLKRLGATDILEFELRKVVA